MIYVTIGVIVLAVCVFLYYQNNKLDITEYSVESDAIVNTVRVVQLSDLHSKPFGKVLEQCRTLQPDIIAVTGDFINDRKKHYDKMLTYAKALCAVAPVFYITGNHERRLAEFDDVMQALSDCGFRVLLNEAETVSVNGNAVSILGLDENQADFEDYKARKNGTFAYRNMKPYFDGLAAREGFKIVLSHFPENFEAVPEMRYAQYDFDLQLSGHAHGGQFILPFFGPVFSPGQGIHPQYARGSFGTRPMLIVSRGLANAEFPFRLFNHPEINVIDIK